MRYIAAGRRCAIDLCDLQLPLSHEAILVLLTSLQFRVERVDIVALARACIGKSRYRLGSCIDEAPFTVDCSSFVKWLYAQKGVSLPRLAVQQRDEGVPVDGAAVAEGDLFFTTGKRNLYHNDCRDGVGHVGIATGQGTIIHAACAEHGVVETRFESFVRGGLRGIRRIVSARVPTVIAPAHLPIERSDDIRWLLLKHLR